MYNFHREVENEVLPYLYSCLGKKMTTAFVSKLDAFKVVEKGVD